MKVMNCNSYKTLNFLKVVNRQNKNLLFSNSSHLFSKAITTSKKDKIKRTSSAKTKKELIKEGILSKISKSCISNYINNDVISTLDDFCKSYKQKSVNYSFVINDAVAGEIVDRILNYEEKCDIVELNPGLGVITLHLIKKKVPKITFINTHNIIELSFKQLLKEHSENVPMSLESYHQVQHVKNFDLMNYILQFDCGDKLTKFIGVLPNISLLSYFITLAAFEKNWSNPHSKEFYFLVESNTLNRFIQNNGSRGKYYIYCLFELLFSRETLGEYAREAFLPFTQNKETHMCLIKLTRKPNHLGLSDIDMKVYIEFLKLLGRSRYNFIIPTLEKLVPECGLHLICHGISMNSQVQDLEYFETLKIFEVLKLCKGYEHFKSFCLELNS